MEGIRLNRGLALLVVGAVALLLASCADDSDGGNSITVPAKPDAPTITATSDTMLTISWGALSDATQYRVFRSTTEGGTYERLATADESITTISYTNSGLTIGTIYYYRVAACSANTDASCSVQSAVASGITRALPTPAAPTVTATRNTILTISWSALSDAAQYRLYRSSTEDGTYKRIAADESITTASYANNGLTAEITYYYRLAACGGNTDASCSAQSAVASGTTVPSTPAVPTVTTTNDAILIIAWSAVLDATQYRLYRSATEDGTYARIVAADVTSYTNSGLTAGTTYYYRVAACSSSADSSCSAQSATASGITTPSIPGAVRRVGNQPTGFGVRELLPSGIAAINDTLYMVGQTTDALYTLDISTGLATRVGTASKFGVSESSPFDLAAINDTLYMVGVRNSALYTLDTNTGIATRVGMARRFGIRESVPTGLAAINDTLYMVGWSTEALHTLDTSTGIATRVGMATEFGVDESTPYGLAAINDTLYMVGQTTHALYTLDTDNGFATRVGMVSRFGTGRSVATGLGAINNTLYMADQTTDALFVLWHK